MMNSPVLTIKERLGIEEVVSSYIKLERAGSNLKARCPFHNEKSPSFFVSPDRGSYYCFGCGAKGDIFTFVEEFEGLDFKGSLKLLADRAHVSLGAYTNLGAESEKDRLYEVMEVAAKFFEKNFAADTEASNYLKNRGLTEETISSFRVGYAKNEWRDLHQFLRSKNFTESEIDKAGLSKKSDKVNASGQESVYDRFRGRIMFPIMDSSGRVIAFSGRLFPDTVPTPNGVGTPTSQNAIVGAKYLNSPETAIFKKSAVLYGLDKSKLSIRKHNFSILVEGQIDLLLSHQAGWTNTVATSGTAFSEELERDEAVSNLGLLRRISSNLVIAFDGDNAGIKAALRASKIAMSLGMDVKIAKLPEGQDPADIVAKEGKDAWKVIIKNSMPVVEFVLGGITASIPVTDRKLGLSVKEKVLPYVSILGSRIDQEFFLKKISGATGIPVATLNEDLATVAKSSEHERKTIETIEKEQLEVLKKDYILRRLLGLVFWQSGVKEVGIDAQKLITDIAEATNQTESELTDRFLPIKEDLIYEAEVFYSGGADLKRDIIELINNLKEENLKEELARKMHELYLAEEAKDQKKVEEILKECQIINNKIQEIKSSRSS